MPCTGSLSRAGEPGPGARLSDRLRRWIGRRLSDYLAQAIRVRSVAAPMDLRSVRTALRPADVLLVEGNSRVSTAIKYLTQSTWSHAALYIGETELPPNEAGEPLCFIEADVRDGVRAVPLTTYAGLHGRICRPCGLAAPDRRAVIEFAVARLGHQYDLKNIIDLGRYLLPTPPVPVRWRRQLVALGSGDPTRAICSTLIAQAFQSIRYPILPEITQVDAQDPMCADCIREILHIRHHSLFVPRDFDVSPYFAIVKPWLDENFDHRSLHWGTSPATMHEPNGDSS